MAKGEILRTEDSYIVVQGPAAELGVQGIRDLDPLLAKDRGRTRVIIAPDEHGELQVGVEYDTKTLQEKLDDIRAEQEIDISGHISRQHPPSEN
jgi:hypothetical protein